MATAADDDAARVTGLCREVRVERQGQAARPIVVQRYVATME